MTTTIQRVSLLSSLLTCAVLASTTATATAQIWNVPSTTSKHGFHGNSADRSMVRLGSTLYSAVVLESGHVNVYKKTDNVTSAWRHHKLVSDAYTKGRAAVAMTGTSSGYLHITWGYYNYGPPTTSGYYRQFYRCIRASDGATMCAVKDITAGPADSTTKTITDAMAIAVDGNNRVYLVAQDGTKNWRSRLLRSNFTNYAASPTWTSVGAISPNIYSSKNVSMVVDRFNNVHVGYYNNTGNGCYATRIYRAVGGWTAQTILNSPPVPRDDDGYLAADPNGRVHVLYKHRVNASTYQLRHRQRTGTGAWSSAIVVEQFTTAQVGAESPVGSFALACSSDRIFAIYLEYKTGRLMVKQKTITGTVFRFLSKLRPNSSAKNAWHRPSVRSTCWPTSNRMSKFLDVTWIYPVYVSSTLTNKLYHQRLHVSEMILDKLGCGGPEITMSGVPYHPTSRNITIGLEKAQPLAATMLFLSLSPSVSIPLPSGPCKLLADFPATSGMLVNGYGHQQVSFPLGGGGMSDYVYLQWVTYKSGVWKTSTRGRLRL